MGKKGFPHGAVDVPRGAVDAPRDAVDAHRGVVEVPRGAVEVPRGVVDAPRGVADAFSGAKDDIETSEDGLADRAGISRGTRPCDPGAFCELKRIGGLGRAGGSALLRKAGSQTAKAPLVRRGPGGGGGRVED